LLAIDFRLAPTASSSSFPATNPDALTGHQLNETVLPYCLWKQVQKSSKFVDFTKVGALLRFSWAATRFAVRKSRIAVPEPAILLKESGVFSADLRPRARPNARVAHPKRVHRGPAETGPPASEFCSLG
jgi:hypothetical protein